MSNMESSLKSHLLNCAAQYGNLSGLADSTIGRLAAMDGRFFERLRAGRTFTARKYDEVMGWFVANWPQGHELPRTSHEEEKFHTGIASPHSGPVAGEVRSPEGVGE